MRIFVAGDTHGNAHWLSQYLFPTAQAVGADRIVVLGDFGYWEHTAEGVDFLNRVDCMVYDSNIPLLWLAGNHDKWSLAMKLYGQNRDDMGFVVCRDGVRLIPNGHRWSWAGRTLRAFGGAYSIDKQDRVDAERSRFEHKAREEKFRAARSKRAPRAVAPQVGTLWFPEEQMSDEEMVDLLTIDSGVKDVVLSHDKPLSARPGWSRKPIDECLPNQTRLEAALRAHRPTYWLHGHLHHFYRDTISATGTEVVGLDPDRRAAEAGWSARQSWALLELSPQDVKLTVGPAAIVDKEKFLYALQRQVF